MGKIVATNPGFDTEVKDGSSIKLVVSKGFIQKMPNLIGMKMNEAKDILRKLGLAVGEIKEVQTSGTSGNIIVQSPTPEQTVKTGDTVNLMVIK
jgi:serine/threonine-protein kinase